MAFVGVPLTAQLGHTNFCMQGCLDWWPFGSNDAEHDRISDEAIAHHHVTAQNTFFLGADSLDGVSGFGVALIREEFDAIACQSLECMAKHQVLCFGVDMGSLTRGGEESEVNFEPTVCGLNAAKARTANNFA